MARQRPTQTSRTARPSRQVKAQFQNAVLQQAQILAENILRRRLEEIRRVNTGRVFTRFDTINDVVPNQKAVITRGLFSGGSGVLKNFYTSSEQTSTQKTYYYEVWNSASFDCPAEPQFSVAYGHFAGSGSDFSGNDADSPTRAIYSQYRLLLLEPDDTKFTKAGSTDMNSVYIVNFNRARLKEKLDPGNWELWLGHLNGNAYTNNAHTGSNVEANPTPGTIQLIDDSGDTNEELRGNAGRIHNIVSGTISAGIYKDNADNPVYYGLSYPDMGMLVLDGAMLDTSASFGTVTGSDVAGDNAYKLYFSMTLGPDGAEEDSGFIARNSENLTSTYYFCRVKNAEYNFSNNPTWTTGGLGEIAQPTFVGNPKTYVTTVGMYNDRQELLAVAKMSKPILKSFTNELVLRVKLDF